MKTLNNNGESLLVTDNQVEKIWYTTTCNGDSPPSLLAAEVQHDVFTQEGDYSNTNNLSFMQSTVSSANVSVKPIYTTAQIITQLTTSWGYGDTLARLWGASCDTPSTPAAVISFGINTLVPTNFSAFGLPLFAEGNGLTAMTAVQVATARLSFHLWDNLIASSLVESDGGAANITLNYSSTTTNNGTYSSTLAYNTTPNKDIVANQIWLSTTWASNSDSGMAKGAYGLFTMLHEIGHALGLSHPGTYNGGGVYATDAVFAQDNRQYTVMSYFGGYNATTNEYTQDGTYSNYKYPQTPMVYDIAAVQSLYGADTTTRTGDTVYGYNKNFAANDPEKAIFDFSINATPLLTIWDAGGSNDTLDCSGWNGNQIIDLTPGNYSSVRGLNNNVGIAFNTVIENAVGGMGNDRLIGNSADNILNGGAGADIMLGGLGNDTYHVDNAGDVIVENVNAGVDTVYARSNCVLTDNIENLMLTGVAAINGTGNTLNNQLVGNTASNILNGDAGNDLLDGGVSDVYNPSIVDILNGGTGNDTFVARGFFGTGYYNGGADTDLLDFSQSDSYTAGRRSAEGAGVKVDLAAGTASSYYLKASNIIWTDANGQISLAGIENVKGTNQGDSLSGDANANVLDGGAGNDTLIGKGNNDTLIGGTGNDTYVIDGLGYTLTEAATAEIDTVQASINFDLNSLSNIENLTLIGAALTATGNGLDNVLTGNTMSNTLNGGAGNDTLDGGVSDSYNPTITDTLNGDAGNDTFLARGFYGAGKYNGGADTDLLDFSQSDYYTAVRRSAEGAGVKVDLAAGTASSYYLKTLNYAWADANGQIALANIENIRGTTQGDSLTGDSNANYIDGNAGSDVINGGAGNDILDGGVSDVYNPGIVDILIGGAGNDTFLARGFFGTGYYNGGADTDLLDFSQSDSYTAARRSAEGAGVKLDLAAGTASSYYLKALNYAWADINGQIAVTGIENVKGTTQGDSLSGDANANVLDGGAGNDTLIGKGNNDTLIGGAGNDTYIIDGLGYTLTEAATAEIDTVQASINFDLNSLSNIENLTLIGAALTATGNGLDNVLTGNTMSNTLNGGAGNDTLDGGVSDSYNPTITDTLNGDAGNDTFLARGFYGAGKYNGGADTDLLDFSQSDYYTAVRRSAEGAGVKVDLAAGTASSYYLKTLNIIWTDANGQIALANIENIRGTTQGDSLTGDSNANYIDGNAGSDVINGGAGNDILDGGVSDVYNPGIVDILIGGAGNDTFLARGFFGTGYYNGGADTDLLDFSQSDSYTAARRSAEGAGVKVDLAAGTASSYYLKALNYAWADINGQIAVTGIENVKGTNQGDSLSGDANANVLDGGAGNDTLIGKGNNDTLIGGAGNDTYIIDGLGYVLTEAATAEIDTVQASINFDLNSLSNIENLALIGAALTATGNGLDNVLTGNSMSNTLNGGAGNDTLDGGVSDSYNPTMTDTLNGEAGNDTFLARGFYGAGKYNGGADTDLLDFSQADYYTAVRRSAEGAGVKVDLAAGTASSYYLKTLNYAWADANGQIALANIENIRGTTQGDSLTGDSNANYIDGNAGSDVINGGAGNDILDGGVSDVYNPGIVDILNGGTGNDTFVARGFFGAGYYNGGADTDLLDFSQSDSYTAARRSAEGAGVKVDLAAGTASSYYLKALNYAWADINGQIAVTGIENVKGTNQGDSLSGDANANVLDGGAGNDNLYGQNGADIFIGGLGKDSYSLAETIAAIDTVRIETGDSLVGSYDVVQGFTLGTINTANADILDLDSTSIAINGAGNGNDVGTGVTMISSHSIANSIISFDNLGCYDAPVAIRSGTQMNNVLSYLQANITGCDTVAFVSEGNTFVFQDGGVIDTLVELIGVIAHSVNITGLVDSLWIV